MMLTYSGVIKNNNCTIVTLKSFALMMTMMIATVMIIYNVAIMMMICYDSLY